MTELGNGDRPTPTLAGVEKSEAKTAEFQARVVELDEQVRDLDERITAALVAGDDVSALNAERREADELRDVIRRALPRLRELDAEDREAAACSAAHARMSAILRSAASLVDNARKDNARIKRLAGTVRERIERRAARSVAHGDLHLEAEVIARRFGLPHLTLPVLAVPAQDPELAAALLPVRDALPSGRGRTISTDGPLDLTPRDDGTVLVRGTSGSRVISGETGRILAAGGPWSRTREDSDRDRVAANARAEEQKQAERDRVDSWLRALVADGPVSADAIKVEARQQGIALSGSGTLGANLMAAFERLRIVELHRAATSKDGQITRDRTTVLWGLPNYDSDAFAVIDGQRSKVPLGAMRW
jgi:hypothetical protein